MAIYNLGAYMRAKREELGLTQDDVCEGICSAATYSRIESGMRTPQRDTAIAIFQRLGFAATFYSCYTSEDDMKLAEKIYRINETFVIGKKDEAYRLFDELTSMIDIHTAKMAKSDRQYCLLFDTVRKVESGEWSYEKALEEEIKIIQITRPNFSLDRFPRVLSYEEILTLNNMAIAYGRTDRRDIAIDIYKKVLEFHKRRLSDTVESLRTVFMIISNLAKYLCMEGRYTECIRICEKGIEGMKCSGRYRFLPTVMYVYAFALVNRNNKGDMEKAEQSAKKAYILAATINVEQSDIDLFRRFYEENFDGELPSIT